MAWSTPHGFLLSEDEAMKRKLQGLTVSDLESNDPKNAKQFPDGLRPVKVRFRLPQDEIADMDLPLIVISSPQVVYAAERAISGSGIQLPYAPDGYDIWFAPDATEYDPAQSPYFLGPAQGPVPYDLYYTVTVYSRLARDHNRVLTARLMQPDLLPKKDGYLVIPQDGTSRWLDVMAGPETTYHDYDTELEDDAQKRLIATSFSVRVTTELLAGIQLPYSGTLVTELNIDLSAYSSLDDIAPMVTEERSSVTAGASAGWNMLASQ